MVLEELLLHRFRNYESCEVRFPPGLVMLVGPNASGKTNLLEAVHVLCTATSHRGARDADMAAWGGSRYAVRGTVSRAGQPAEIAVTYDAESGKRVHVHGSPLARRSALLDHAAAVAFSPDDLRLVKGEPVHRRRFIDRLAAVVDRRHAADLSELRAVLEQRNRLLRDIKARRTAPALADLFDEQYLAVASRVIARRVAVLYRALPEAAAALRALSAGREDLGAVYLEGGELPHDLIDQARDPAFWLDRGWRRLEQLRSDERERGMTLWGPMRDDLQFTIDGRDVRVHASQGQQRSVVLAWKQAELALTEGAVHSAPLVLLDDVLSELDPSRSAALLQLALRQEQAFVTAAADAQGLRAWLQEAAAVYRIEAGSVQVVER